MATPPSPTLPPFFPELYKTNIFYDIYGNPLKLRWTYTFSRKSERTHNWCWVSSLPPNLPPPASPSCNHSSDLKLPFALFFAVMMVVPRLSVLVGELVVRYTLRCGKKHSPKWHGSLSLSDINSCKRPTQFKYQWWSYSTTAFLLQSLGFDELPFKEMTLPSLDQPACLLPGHFEISAEKVTVNSVSLTMGFWLCFAGFAGMGRRSSKVCYAGLSFILFAIKRVFVKGIHRVKIILSFYLYVRQ